MEEACMSSYEYLREIEPFCVFLLVLFFLGLAFIPKGRELNDDQILEIIAKESKKSALQHLLCHCSHCAY